MLGPRHRPVHGRSGRQRHTHPPGSLSAGAGIWFVISGILAAAGGGWLAGRLSGKAVANTSGYHGLVAWALSTLVVVYLLSSAVGGIAQRRRSAR